MSTHLRQTLSLFIRPHRRHHERQDFDRLVLRRGVRLLRQARRSVRRRGDQGPAHLHEAVREAQRGTGAEQRPRAGQPHQVFPQRRPVRPTGQGLEE